MAKKGTVEIDDEAPAEQPADWQKGDVSDTCFDACINNIAIGNLHKARKRSKNLPVDMRSLVEETIVLVEKVMDLHTKGEKAQAEDLLSDCLYDEVRDAVRRRLQQSLPDKSQEKKKEVSPPSAKKIEPRSPGSQTKQPSVPIPSEPVSAVQEARSHSQPPPKEELISIEPKLSPVVSVNPDDPIVRYIKRLEGKLLDSVKILKTYPLALGRLKEILVLYEKLPGPAKHEPLTTEECHALLLLGFSMNRGDEKILLNNWDSTIRGQRHIIHSIPKIAGILQELGWERREYTLNRKSVDSGTKP